MDLSARSGDRWAVGLAGHRLSDFLSILASLFRRAGGRPVLEGVLRSYRAPLFPQGRITLILDRADLDGISSELEP